MAQCV